MEDAVYVQGLPQRQERRDFQADHILGPLNNQCGVQARIWEAWDWDGTSSLSQTTAANTAQRKQGPDHVRIESMLSVSHVMQQDTGITFRRLITHERVYRIQRPSPGSR